MHARERDVDVAGNAKVSRITNRDLVAPRLIMEEGQCGWRGGIREISERGRGRAMGRSRVVDDFERPWRADGNRRIAAGVNGNRPGRGQRKETRRPRGRRGKGQKDEQEESGLRGKGGHSGVRVVLRLASMIFDRVAPCKMSSHSDK